MTSYVPWIATVLAASAGMVQGPAIDYSGLDELARVVAIMQRDEEPDPAEWRRLFDSSGYAALTRNEFPEAFFTEQLKLVFMPSRQAELQARLESLAGWRQDYLRHFVHVRDRWDEVMAFAGDPLPRSMVPEATRRALEYLPASSAAHGTPPVAFVIFGPDARGYVPVVVDALHAIDRHDELIPFLAHEFHHYFRYARLQYDRSAVAAEDQDILWVLDQLQAEGTANQVNRGPAFKDRVDFARAQPAFHAQYMASPAMIRVLDEQLARMAVPGEREESARALRDALPSSGHPTGFFMANLIAEALGIHPLIEEVGNPFAFLRLYHAAALMTRGMGEIEAPLLSDAALRVVERLELKYVTGSRASPPDSQLGTP